MHRANGDKAEGLKMIDVIEVTDDITGKTFAVDPYAMRDFIASQRDVDARANTDADHEEQAREEAAEEIDGICRRVLTGEDGFSDILKMDYAPGVYDGGLPACGYVEEPED